MGTSSLCRVGGERGGGGGGGGYCRFTPLLGFTVLVSSFRLLDYFLTSIHNVPTSLQTFGSGIADLSLQGLLSPPYNGNLEMLT